MEWETLVFFDREFSHRLQEAETKDTFQTTVSEHLDLVRCVRASYHMAGKKFAYLQKLLWLVVRIFEPKSVSPPHRTSNTGTPRHCLHPSQPLQSGIDDLTDDCLKKAPPSLLAAVASLAAPPMDDSIVEFPYAMASRLVKSCRATKFPFLASAMRMKQNLTTVRELGSAVSVGLRLEWSSYTPLLQVHPKKRRRSMRICKKKSAVACTRWVTFDRALARASLTEETMRQAILEMVRLAREPMLGLLLLGENKR